MDLDRLLWLASPENAKQVLGPARDAMTTWLETGNTQNIPALLSTHDSFESFTLRDAWIAQFGYVVPKPSFTTLAEHGPFLEIGGGKGILAQLLRQAGADVISVDTHPWSDNYDVKTLDHQTAFDTYPDRTLLVSWPDLESNWLNDLLPQFSPGQKLALIGEGRGGCTGNEALWDILGTLTQLDTPAQVWSWPGIHDHLTLWQA